MKYVFWIMVLIFSAVYAEESTKKIVEIPNQIDLLSLQGQAFQLFQGEPKSMTIDRLKLSQIGFGEETMDEKSSVIILAGHWFIRDHEPLSKPMVMLRYENNELVGFSWRFKSDGREHLNEKIQSTFGECSRVEGRKRVWVLRNGLLHTEPSNGWKNRKFSLYHVLWWSSATFPHVEPTTIPRIGKDGLEPPVFTKKVSPNYPELAVPKKVQGYVILEATLRANGAMSDIKVLRTLGKGQYGFEENAVAALKQWEFNPGKIGNEAMDVRLTLKIDFLLRRGRPQFVR